MGKQWIVHVYETSEGDIVVDQDDLTVPADCSWETLSELIMDRAEELRTDGHVRWTSSERDLSGPNTPERVAHERART